jgi:hypothetical protein
MRVLALMLAATLLVAPCALAITIATEPFAYSPGVLNGQNGGTGWSNAWITGQSGAFTVQASGLGAGPPQSGGSLLYDGHAYSSTGARAFRVIDLSSPSLSGLVESYVTKYQATQPALGVTGTTVWLAVVFHGGTAGNGLAGTQYLDQVHLYAGPDLSGTALGTGDNNKNDEVLAIGRGAGNYRWNFERTCGHDNCPGGSTSSTSYVSTVAMDSSSHWLVLRFAFTSAATTNITTWLDPSPGAIDPTDASALVMGTQQVVPVAGVHFNAVEVGGQTARFAFDEIRLATSFAEVSADPAASVAPGAATAPRFAAGPSPSSGVTRLWAVLPARASVDARVTDVSGRLVRSLYSGSLPKGNHELDWDGRDEAGARVPVGLYFVHLRVGATEHTTQVLRVP